MEGLLPVIIALVISAVFGMRKKKDPARQAPGPVAQSPWDDLMRELQGSDEPRPKTYVPQREDDEDEEPQPYFTYEQIPQAEPLSYETPEPVALAEPIREEVLSSQGVIDLTAPSQGAFRVFTPREMHAAAGGSLDEEEEGNAGTVFESGFDPRMAVLYSEVFRPKYLD